MENKCKGAVLKFMMLLCCLAIPILSQAQSWSSTMYGWHSVLEKLFEEMMPLSSRMRDVGRAIAGFAALWYIAMRVWKHIARAEAIDFFPLLRPFGIGMAIALWPFLIGLMNGVLKPIEEGTRAMASDSHMAILNHIKEREKSNRETPSDIVFPNSDPNTEKYEPSQEDNGGFLSGLKNTFGWFNIKAIVQVMITEWLHIIYTAASLCINVIRTFYLVILVIIGPIIFGLSVFDGFENSLVNWFARYIHVYMWLPVANVFGAISSKILENMILHDQGFMSSSAYLIFMVIAIIGYTTVPTVAGYIVQPGGGDTLLHKVNNAVRSTGKAITMAAGKLI